MGVPSTASFLLLLAPLSVLALQPGAPPVCIAGDENCKAPDTDTSCGLWLAPSIINPNEMSLFTGTERAAGEHVTKPDMLVPLYDYNRNEWSPYQDLVWNSDLIHGLPLENKFLSSVFVPGVGSIALCSDSFANTDSSQGSDSQDNAGVHRSSDPAAGSFSDRHTFAFEARRDLIAGEEIIVPCSDEVEVSERQIYKRKGRSLEWLEKNGVCLDSVSVATSTLPGVGRGAFTKNFVRPGQVIASSPVVPIDRSQLEIVEQTTELDDRYMDLHEHGIQYTEKVIGQQLLLNYCLGYPGSNILLLPYAPGVNFINHHSEMANAAVRWSNQAYEEEWLELDPNLLFESPVTHGLVLEYVALRDILPGEEIFIDYGEEWTQAWEKHMSEWKPQDKDYLAAYEYRRLHAEGPIRTQDEQSSNPYPENLRTACYFGAREDSTEDMDSIEWSPDNFSCLRPCVVKERYEEGEEDEGSLYTAVVYPMGIAVEPDYCQGIPEEGLTVTRLPMSAVTVVDKPYSTDIHLHSAFRHSIGVPADVYPEVWMAADSNPTGDFIPSPLKPGEMEVIRWADSGDIVTPNAHRLGFDSRFRETLLDYCNKLGITDYFRHVTIGGNAAPIGTDTYITLNGDQWFLQRPDSNWRSNLQWISPGDEKSQQSYVEALSAAGFDDILAKIGENLGMDGLVAFHVTFIGVSHSTEGFMHYDVTETGRKAFNIIIPLILANETGPELDLQSSDYDKVDDDGEPLHGRYRYELDVASMMGDDAMVSVDSCLIIKTCQHLF
jgi:hypothetical protein